MDVCTFKRLNAASLCCIVARGGSPYLSRSGSRSKEGDKGSSHSLIGPARALHIPSCLSSRTEVGMVFLSRSVGQTENKPENSEACAPTCL